MNCKSCGTALFQGNRFCSQCGGKVVDSRPTLRGTWNEFAVPFFNWDNFFWRTFRDLFTNPKEVLLAYVSGARKKYFHPFSYLIVYGTLAVLVYKLFPQNELSYFTETFTEKMGGGDGGSSLSTKENMQAFLEKMLGYFNFVVIAMIPLLAIVSYLVFRKHRHNFAEHLIFNSYLQAQIGLVSLVSQLLLINVFGIDYLFYSSLSMCFYMLYGCYLYQQLYSLRLGQIVWAFIKFILFGLLLYFLLIIIIGFLVILVRAFLS